MSKHTPKRLEQRLQKIWDTVYIPALEALAAEVMEDRIKPYCIENKLSFTMMNGYPRLVNLEGEYVGLPVWMVNLAEVCDPEGNRLMWHLETFEYQPTDFNKADIDHFKKKREAEQRYYGEFALGAAIFSPGLLPLLLR